MTAATIAARLPVVRSLAWHRVALGGVLLLATLLDVVRLDRNGWANSYYSAAVRSMTLSWHNFFFASFDPGGLVSVDKPPLGLWVEAASAKLFGFSSLAILLPEALAGVAAVALVYLLVARYFGRVAGLVSALALAVSPVSVAVNRDNNPDALFVLALVAAAYVGARAVESGRLRTLLLTALLVGLAFNTKMLAAAIVVPALGLAYLAFAPGGWGRRLWQLGVAGAAMVVVSGAWIAAVDLTPAASRPYVGSTTDNSALSLALGYNGLGRVTGQTGGTSLGGGGGGAFSGTPGWFRLVNDALGDQGAWLLPLALAGGVSLLLGLLAARSSRPQLGAFTILAGWFVTAAAIFSLSSGIIHTYYLSALAPATAALVGAGAVALWRDVRRGGGHALLPLVAIAGSAWLEVTLLQRTGYQSWLQTLVVVSAAAASVVVAALALPRVLPARGKLAGVALGIALAGLLAAPLAWSASTWTAAVNGVFPGAGPSFVGAGGGGLGFGGGGRAGGPGGDASGSSIESALAYVQAHGASTRFALIVSSEQEAAASVIRGESVASMGGFTGRETVLTNSYLSSLVRSGDARYFLLGGGRGIGGPGGTNNAAATTISSTCTTVSTAAVTSGTLYDCAGKADAIAAAG